jgi:hypothetical protein
MYTVSLRERALALARAEEERREQERLRVERDLEERLADEADELFGALADGAELKIRTVWKESGRPTFSHLEVLVGDLEFRVDRNGLISVRVGNCQRCNRAVFRPVKVSKLVRIQSRCSPAESLLTEVGRVLLSYSDGWGCEQCVSHKVYASPADSPGVEDSVGEHGEDE